MRALLLLALLGGCSNLLGIHQLDDAGGGNNDDGSTDGIAPNDGMTDGMMTDAGTDGSINTVQIGEYTLLSAQTSMNANTLIARKFSVTATTVVVAGGAYLKFETTGGRVKFAVYSDNANAPYSRRTLSGDVTVDGTAGYNEGAFGSHTLAPGTYWIVMATDASLDIGSVDSNDVSGAGAALAYASALPSTFSPQPTSTLTADRINLYLQAQP
jgi:hypothetical protein